MRVTVAAFLAVVTSALAAPIVNTTPVYFTMPSYDMWDLVLDVDGNGISDIHLKAAYWDFSAGPGDGGEFIVYTDSAGATGQFLYDSYPDDYEQYWVQKFDVGADIGPTSGPLNSGCLRYRWYRYMENELLFDYRGGYFDEPGILGFRFEADDGYHWGWALITWDQMSQWGWTGARIAAYGYESLPDTPIAAGVPEPASLGLLVIGLCLVSRKTR